MVSIPPPPLPFPTRTPPLFTRNYEISSGVERSPLVMIQPDTDPVLKCTTHTWSRKNFWRPKKIELFFCVMSKPMALSSDIGKLAQTKIHPLVLSCILLSCFFKTKMLLEARYQVLKMLSRAYELFHTLKDCFLESVIKCLKDRRADRFPRNIRFYYRFRRFVGHTTWCRKHKYKNSESW